MLNQGINHKGCNFPIYRQYRFRKLFPYIIINFESTKATILTNNIAIDFFFARANLKLGYGPSVNQQTSTT